MRVEQQSPLLYEWYQEHYVGAAHGLSGIYYYLMQVKSTIRLIIWQKAVFVFDRMYEYYIMELKQFSLYPCSPVSSLTTASCQLSWSPAWITCASWSYRQVISLHVLATIVISWCTGATALLESSTCFCRPTRYERKNQNHRELIGLRPALTNLPLYCTPCRSTVRD